MSLTKEDHKILLQIAQQSIQYGLVYDQVLTVKPLDYSEPLREKRATFVTLTIYNQLRGCIGTLTAYRPLVSDVAYHAYAAAFSDPRFPKLQHEELLQLAIHISILSPPVALSFKSEEDLLRQLHPGVDGLIISEGGHQGTFLPSVWESLSNPRDFLCHLKQKAGLAPHYWSDTLKVERYTAEYIP